MCCKVRKIFVLRGVICCVTTVHVKGHEMGRIVQLNVFTYQLFKWPLYFCDYCLLHWLFVLYFLVHNSGQLSKFRDPVIINIHIYFYGNHFTNIVCVFVCVCVCVCARARARARVHTLLFSLTRPNNYLWAEYGVCCTKEVNIVLLQYM